MSSTTDESIASARAEVALGLQSLSLVRLDPANAEMYLAMVRSACEEARRHLARSKADPSQVRAAGVEVNVLERQLIHQTKNSDFDVAGAA